MRRSSVFFTLTFLVAVGCNTPPPSTPPVADRPATVPSEGAYTVEGFVRDTRGQPVHEARIEVIAPGFHGRFATSANDGRYHLSDLSGGVQLRASKGGYFPELHGIRPGGGVFDFRLQPIEWVIPGRPVHQTLTNQHPVCATDLFGGNGREASCHRFLMNAPSDGVLLARVTSTDDFLTVAIVGPNGGDGVSVDDGRQAQTMTVRRGVTYEVWILGRVDKPARFQFDTSID